MKSIWDGPFIDGDGHHPPPGAFSDSITTTRPENIDRITKPGVAVEIYEGRRGFSVRKQWRWRIRAANGRIVANGGEGYANKADLLRALEIVRFATGALAVTGPP